MTWREFDNDLYWLSHDLSQEGLVGYKLKVEIYKIYLF